jgi:hypothetical protein
LIGVINWGQITINFLSSKSLIGIYPNHSVFRMKHTFLIDLTLDAL